MARVIDHARIRRSIRDAHAIGPVWATDLSGDWKVLRCSLISRVGSKTHRMTEALFLLKGGASEARVHGVQPADATQVKRLAIKMGMDIVCRTRGEAAGVMVLKRNVMWEKLKTVTAT